MHFDGFTYSEEVIPTHYHSASNYDLHDKTKQSFLEDTDQHNNNNGLLFEKSEPS